MSAASVYSRRILIAGDVLEHRDFAVRMLETGGCTVEFADDATQALRAVERSHYDLILLRVDRPDSDRLDATAVNEARPLAAVSVPTVAVAAPLSTVRLLELIEQHARPRSGDADIAALASGYLAARTQELAELKTHLAQRHFDAIRRWAHRVKGTGRSYGFEDVTNLAGTLETAAQAGDEAGVRALLEALDTTVARLRASPSHTSHEESS